VEDGIAATLSKVIPPLGPSSLQILTLFDEDRARIETLGRKTPSALRLHQLLQARPITAVPAAARRLGVSQPTVSKSMAQLVRLGMVKETTGRQRDRHYAYDRYLAILNEGTEPLPR
jgi:Fic family protein